MGQDSENLLDFSSLIMGFSSAALHYLGEGGGVNPPNLALARQNIEIIRLLKQKTQGNLAADEAALIERVTVDLQIKFIEISKNRS